LGKLLTAKEREEKPQRTLNKAFTTEEIERHEQTGILARALMVWGALMGVGIG